MKIKDLNSNRLRLLIISFCLLFTGFITYLIFNQHTPISTWIVDILPKAKVSMPQNIITMVIIDFGADFLWSISFTLIIQFILWLQKKQTVFLITCSFLGLIFEIMQCFGLANGTADILDVVAYLFGSLVAIAVIQGGKLYEQK